MDERGVRSLVAGLILFAPLALFGGAFGSVLRYPDVGAAVLFPPYAALTAALLVSRRRDWIWYIALAVAAHVMTSWPEWPLSWVLLADVANVARALVAAVLLRRAFVGLPRFDSLKSLFLFVGIAVLAAPAVGASIGAANVPLHGASDTYGHAWSAWFVSNALTGLTMLPGFVAAFAYVTGIHPIRATSARVKEALVLAIVLVATSSTAFLGNTIALTFYAFFPALIWAALRFGPGGTSAALTVITVSAILIVDRGLGPFREPLPENNIFALQTFLLFTAASALCLAAIAAGRQAVADLHQALLASLEDQVAIVDVNGVVLEVNESWRRFADRPGMPAFQRVRPGDRYLAVCESAADGPDVAAARLLAGLRRVLSGAERSVEIEHEHGHGGRQETYTMRVEVLERPEGGAVITRANVTAERQVQTKIEQQRQELLHLARVAVLGELSGAFAHELNQPLTAILSNAEAARRFIAQPAVDLKLIDAILQDIVEADRRAAAVIGRLRAMLTRGERQHQPVRPDELIDEVLGLAHAELLARRVAATAVVEPDLPPVMGDKVQLQQVLLNLILNGCEAMSTNVSQRRIFVSAWSETSRGVHITVRDCGTGIPPDLLGRLFEPFVTTKPNGLGLGLSISQTIVATHGGRLWAENNADSGATLHCLLPVTAPRDVVRSGSSPRVTAPSQHGS